jgi:hypothetical protein
MSQASAAPLWISGKQLTLKKKYTKKMESILKKLLYPECSLEINKNSLEELKDKFVHKPSGCLPSENVRWYSWLQKEMNYTLYSQSYSSHKPYSYQDNHTRDLQAA